MASLKKRNYKLTPSEMDEVILQSRYIPPALEAAPVEVATGRTERSEASTARTGGDAPPS